MNTQEYIQACLRTESDLTKVSALSIIDRRIIHAILGLADEAGELVKVAKSRFAYDTEFDFTNLVEEASDLCWYLSLLLDAIGTTWEEVWEVNIAKLKARYPHKFTNEAAINRDTVNERKAMEDLLE